MYNSHSDKPLVSIVIPTYNRKDMLKVALDSVLEQDYENIEIIVADNASTDGTDLLMQEYIKNNENIIYIKRKINIGPLDNGYMAYKEVAKGKYMYFLCDDDYLISQTFIKNAVEIFDKYPNVMLVTGHVQMYFEEYNRYITIPYLGERLVRGIDYLFRQSTVTLPHYYPEIISLFFLIRKDFLDKNNFFHSFKESGDLAIRFSFSAFGDIYFLKEFVGCYVLHNGVRETSNINSLYNDCNSTLKFIDNIVSLYSNLYPQYADFFQDYIPIKIADAFIRDRIFKTFHLYKYTKEKIKKIKKFLKESGIKNKNKKIFNFLYNVLITNHSHISISPLIYENVYNSYTYFSILRIVFYNINTSLLGFLIDKNINRLKIWLLFFNITINLKPKYYKIPQLYAYASKDIKKSSKLDVYYIINKYTEKQITSDTDIDKLIAVEDIKENEPITKSNTHHTI